MVVAGLLLAPAAFAQRPHFDPQNDYAYDLTATADTVASVALDAEGFSWPDAKAWGNTMLLEITVAASGDDGPRIDVTTSSGTRHQVFEAGAKGRRFLDLSGWNSLTPGEHVALKGSGLTWSPGPAKLFSYHNAPPTAGKVLVVAPHPDDAEIAAFGLYRQTGADVVTVTAGDAGGENFGTLFTDKGEHYRVKGWIRTWDSITVPFYGGIPPGRARNLGYYDATLRQMKTAPATPVLPLLAKLDDPAFYRRCNVDPELRQRAFQATWDNLVSDLLRELERVKPTLVAAPHPLLDAHADHQYTTIALIEALAQWPGQCELYLYTNHALENEAFPLGDRGAMTGLPATSRAELFFSRICSFPLTTEDQKLKLVALEDMHDLRAFDLRDGTPPVEEETRRSWKEHDYYRRGPRPNELFFVLSKTDALKLRESFLSGR